MASYSDDLFGSRRELDRDLAKKQSLVPISKKHADPDEMERRGASPVVFTSEDRRRSKAKTGEVLAKLIDSDGWVSTGDLIPINHRFSASINVLRQQGHVIEKRRRDGGEFEYRYVERLEACLVGVDEQAKYYRSKHWQKMRERRLAHDGHQCCNCHCSTDLEVHHWRYDLYEERLGDLMTLCRECHERMHANVKVAFPKLVPQWIHDRIDEG